VIALEVAGPVHPRPVRLVGELANDLRAGGPSALVMGVGIVNDGVDADRRLAGLAQGHSRPGRQSQVQALR
jgi:hypothetical protein